MEIPRRRVATRIVRGDERRPRRGDSAVTSRDVDSPRRRVVAATRTFGRDRRRRYASEEIAPAKRRPAPAPRYAEREVVETDHVDEVPASSLMGKVTVVDYDACPRRAVF